MTTTTHPMTGLRQVILDAIQGVSPADSPACASLPRGAFSNTQAKAGSDVIISVWRWSPDWLDARTTDDLMTIYDTLRPGVLGSM
jgi:hypothetical protein